MSGVNKWEKLDTKVNSYLLLVHDGMYMEHANWLYTKKENIP